MNALINQLNEKIDLMSMRERLLIMLVLLALLFTGFDTLLLQPMAKQEKAQLARERAGNTEIQTLTMAMVEITERKSADPDRETRELIERHLQQLNKLDAELYDFSQQLIPPSEMTRLLERVLKDEKGLKLLKVESLKPAVVGGESEDEDEESRPLGGIYQHGLRIEFEGGYLETLAYLRKLEALPWRLYWDTLTYNVERYPESRASIVVNTLSFNENWIGM
ncbi:hypothetical protein BOW53_10740 [Solemya pervernicosa gill symbiont]|uniref:MSHA biogenesis protein MshJ n=2 Tax=Gammaproteobacteria incertae sedis TaxID=118884 RepID=A0A1T2L3D5_9GAMM|nr:hypothetical protein [Candidatus Reidiella endopervernicosa]OOZ39613.1 hypothetical protein BOW53_10740 [Solemya pervernicosa gill symbiont]QKQ25458.1 hypothetical protein HUE57_03450 [Candidatus Reidiella endopervernicosa]